MTIMVGIVTCNRPQLFAQCAASAHEHLQVDRFFIYNDGSNPVYHAAYDRAYRLLPATILSSENHGVGYAKNRLLEAMLNAGAAWLFLLEDDIRITSPEAVTGYIRACDESGLDHLSFAHHGPLNVTGPVEVCGPVSLYPHCVGAWAIYSRECLEEVGLFDEGFRNAWEHVEHSLRLAKHGYTTGAWQFADATGSQDWLEEIPGDSAIRHGDWMADVERGRDHWRTAHPDTYPVIFGPA